MSIAALNWAWSQQAPTSTAKLVLVALADHANADGECWPSMGAVAELAQCSTRQVARCIDALEDAGLLTRTRRRLTAGKLGGYTFRLAIDHKTPTSTGHPRPVDTADHKTPTSGGHVSAGQSHATPVTSGHPRPSPPDTGVRTEPSVEPKPLLSDVPSDPEVSEDARRLTRQLALAVKANGHKVPAKGRKAHREWLLAMDRLIRLDNADPGEVEQVVRWATEDVFWRANVRSAPKFREQYPSLRLRMLADREPRTSKPRQDPVAARFGEGAR